jgi:polysaccharide biosynthesis/export protein
MLKFGLIGRIAIAILISSLLTGCTVLPRSGPTKADVYQTSFNRIPIIPITASTSKLTYLNTPYPWNFSNKSHAINYETLDVDDKIDLNIWENASEKLYTGSQQGPSDLGTLAISGSGDIYIPYLGKVKAAGNTIEQLQYKLTSLLKNKVIHPQVIVRKVERLSKQISIQGVVAKPGTYAITVGRHDLLSLLAEAGGSTVPPDLTEVKLERKGNKFKTTLKEIYQSANKNINLYPRDNVILNEINHSFISLGATGTQKLIKFPKSKLSLMEAIALVEGLNDDMANPSHVFLLRNEKIKIINRFRPASKTDLKGRAPVIYELDMRQMQAVFAAKQFKVRDADLIITVDAPYTNVRKILSSLSPAIGLGRTTL